MEIKKIILPSSRNNSLLSIVFSDDSELSLHYPTENYISEEDIFYIKADTIPKKIIKKLKDIV